MQFWITFVPGVGGDGLANLLEFSSDIVSYDFFFKYQSESPTTVIEKKWHIDRYVDNSVKFCMPDIDRDHAFRLDFPFKKENNELNLGYLNAIKNNQNVVVTSHDISCNSLKHSDYKDIFTKDQILILLTSKDLKNARRNVLVKNLITDKIFNDEDAQMSEYYFRDLINENVSKFDMCVNIEDIINSWCNFYSFCRTLNLKIEKQYFDQYQLLRQGKLILQSNSNTSNNSEIKHYKSYLDPDTNFFSYTEI